MNEHAMNREVSPPGLFRSVPIRCGALRLSPVLAIMLVALLLLTGGCRTIRPAMAPQYAPPQPVLERSEEPVIHMKLKDPDVRLVSEYRPDRQWLDRTERGGFHHGAGHRKVQEIFFQDLPLGIAVELLNDVAGVNLMLQGSTAGERVKLYLKDVPLSTAVETLLRGNDLWFRSQGDVTTVMTEEAFADSMVFQQSEKIQAFFMRYSNARDMAALLATILGPEVVFRDMTDQSVYGHLEDGSDGGGVATDAIGEVISDADRRQLLKLGQGDVALSLEEAARTLGRTAPAVITVFKKNNALVVRSADDGLLRHITGLIRELDTPVRQVLLEVRIVRLELGEGFESFFDITFSREGTSSTLGISSLGGAANLASNTLAAVFSRRNIDVRLELFAREGRMSTISSPFLLTADNAEVRFFVGQQVPLRTGVTKETVRASDLQDLVIFIPQVVNREIGTELELKSFINADHTITMDIVANIETPNFNVSDITLVNDRTGQPIQFPLDGVDKNELESIMAVPSGHTVALGGFIRLEDRDSEQKVPILGDIPLLGYLFKRVERGVSRTETVILVTPHIMGHPSEGAAVTERFLDKSSGILKPDEDRKWWMHDPQGEAEGSEP